MRYLILVATCAVLMAQSPRAQSDDLNARVARLEVAVPQIQKQLDDQTRVIGELRQQVSDLRADTRAQFAELNTKMNFFLGIGSILGACAIGSLWKMFSEPRPSSPIRDEEIAIVVRRILESERNNHPFSG